MPDPGAFSKEKAELKKVLASPTFTKSPNLCRLLEYLCSKRLEGSGQELNEYSIAVEALGRGADFDPGTSSIVRVEAHRLREKLGRYYEGEGADHTVLIQLEPGSYAPQFVTREPLAPSTGEGVTGLRRNDSPSEPASASPSATPGEGESAGPEADEATGVPTSRLRSRLVIFAVGLAVVVLLLAVFTWRLETRQGTGTSMAIPAATTSSLVATPADEIRILCGYSKENYIDHRGKVWQGDRYYKGGSPSSISQQTINRTLDPTIFQQSRTGDFAYDIPLKPGIYELRLYFAETQFGPTTFSGGGESSRVFDASMNGKPLLTGFDVYSSAMGDDVAYERVFKDVTPDADGYLHLKFFPTARERPFLNAMEIDPGIPGRLRPIRLAARDNSYTDKAGNVWSPDSFFLRGRIASHPGPVEGGTDPELYTTERYGNFDYAIPVGPGTYGVTFRFAETYFGAANAGFGGVGSRVFDVFCNGVPLIRNLDIIKEAGGANRALDKTFHHLVPNSQSLLDFSFVPSQNYAEVNSIEVVDESP